MPKSKLRKKHKSKIRSRFLRIENSRLQLLNRHKKEQELKMEEMRRQEEEARKKFEEE
jgi:hypothetical protein